MKFEDLIAGYSLDVVDHSQFLLNLLITALLSWILSVYYRKYGRSVGNRSAFSNNFILLALTTMLIIYIVKASIALSLGLVGALSIVRFRAAIKEPEELTYLFLVIGIGIGMGANQAGITVIAFLLIMAIMILKTRYSNSVMKPLQNQMVVNISSESLDETDITKSLEKSLNSIELRRFSHDKGKTYMTFVVEAEGISSLSEVKKSLLEKDDSTMFTFVDNKNIAG